MSRVEKNKSFVEMRKRKFSTRAEFAKAIGVHESTALGGAGRDLYDI